MKRTSMLLGMIAAVAIAGLIALYTAWNAKPGSAGVVLQFKAADVQQGNLPVRAAALAVEPYVRRVRFSGEEDGKASGVLLFDDVERFSRWRETEMAGFFALLGPGATIQSVKISRSDGLSGPDGDLLGIGDVSIQYRNAENEAEGDADIDAVTVICGDGAECEPSN